MAVIGLRFDERVLSAPIVHDQALIVISFLVAVMAAYATLELAERLHGASGGSARIWHASSSVVLGGGVWAMHAIALLALTTPMVRGDSVAPAALSALVVVFAAALAFWVLRIGAVRGYVSWLHIAGAGTLLGAGVAAMLFFGVSALQAGEAVYRPSLFGLSVVTAIAASTALLWFAVLPTLWWHRALAAIAIAAAFCGLHYTTVAATSFQPLATATAGLVIVAEHMAAGWIALAVAGAVMVSLVAAFHDRQRDREFANEAVRVRKEVARRTVELQTTADQLDAALTTAERASAAKSEFLASMSHELRTPLNSILGFSQLLVAGRSFEPLSAKQLGAMQQIEQAGRHLLLMIDDILDLSRIEAGRLPLSIEEIEVATLIDEATAMLQPTAITASVTLHTDAAFRGLFVRADRRRLLQVIINLLSNAIKYNRQGGSVSVSCREADGEARISISDTGFGIPAHQLDAVFESFNRLGQDWSTTAGNGVGLALCKRLVEAMRGVIRVDSVEGKGSTFSLTLPLGGQTEWVAPMFPPRATVLYIEDNPASVLLMRHIMKEMGGVELVVATTPREGIELARGLKPSLILLDINLPDMDGYETLKAMRADDQISELPVFAVTASALPRELERGVAAGFDHYLTKPLNIPQFVAAVEVALTQPPVRKQKRARVKREAAAPVAPVAPEAVNTSALGVKPAFQPLRRLSLFSKPRTANQPKPLADPQNQSPAGE